MERGSEGEIKKVGKEREWEERNECVRERESDRVIYNLLIKE